MHRVTIQYAVPGDPDDFDERYFGQHVHFVASTFRPLTSGYGFRGWGTRRR